MKSTQKHLHQLRAIITNVLAEQANSNELDLEEFVRLVLPNGNTILTQMSSDEINRRVKEAVPESVATQKLTANLPAHVKAAIDIGVKNASKKTSFDTLALYSHAKSVLSQGGPVQADWNEALLQDWWEFYGNTLGTWEPSGGRPAPGRGEAQLDMAFKLAPNVRGDSDFTPASGESYGVKYRGTESSGLLTTEDKAPGFAVLRDFIYDKLQTIGVVVNGEAGVGNNLIKKSGVTNLQSALNTSLSKTEKNTYNSLMARVLEQISSDNIAGGKLIVLTKSSLPFVVNSPLQIGLTFLRARENRPDFIVSRKAGNFSQWIFPQTIT